MKCMLSIFSVLLCVLRAELLADETQTVEKADVIVDGSSPVGFVQPSLLRGKGQRLFCWS